MKWLCERSLYGKQQLEVEANTRQEALYKIRIGDFIENSVEDFSPEIHMARVIRKIKD